MLLSSKSTAVLVADESQIVGLVTPRSLLNAVASAASAETTTVEEGAMLPVPLMPSGKLSVLDALHLMQASAHTQLTWLASLARHVQLTWHTALTQRTRN